MPKKKNLAHAEVPYSALLVYRVDNSITYCISRTEEQDMERYFGTYQTFQTESREDGAALVSANNIIGDRYEIECTIEDGIQKAWLVSRFGLRVGYFDPSFSRRLSILKAEGKTLVGVLSLVAFSQEPEPGYYWGEVALFAYDPNYAEEINSFNSGVSSLLGKGVRPRVSFGEEAVSKIIESGGSWMTQEREPLPKQKKDMSILKQKRSFSDDMIEQGRKGNKGCYILSWAFLIALVVLVIVGLKSCGVF